MSTEHPLQHRWVLWEHKSVNNKPEDWANSMRIVCEFSSIEEFWTYWRFVPRPSEVLFDGSTRKGGRRCKFEKHVSNSVELSESSMGKHTCIIVLETLYAPLSQLNVSSKTICPVLLLVLLEVEGRSIEAFSVFKKGIRPEWEDVYNRSGSDLTCR